MCHDLLGNSSRKKHWKDVIILLNSTACLSKNWPQQESVYFSLTVLWYVQIIKYILTRWSYSFVCTSYYFIIIIMETYLKVLNFWNACHVNSFSSVYEQFSLQPAHPCFKIDHVGSSGKFSYMFPVYMVITSENEKIIWKVVFKILTYFAKIRALFRHFMGVTQTSGKKTRKLRIPLTEMEQNSLK